MKEYALRRYPLDRESHKRQAELHMDAMAAEGWEMSYLQVTEGSDWSYLTVLYVREKK